MRRYLSEFLGTFALVFAGTGAIVVNEVTAGQVTHVGISLVFGLVVMALVYTLGDISGAHLNPAVTFGFWLDRQFAGRSVLPYILSQVLGALAASLVLRGMFASQTLGTTIPAGSDAQSFVLEMLLTALLMFVVLNVSTGGKEKGQMAGAAVGAVIALEALMGGPICGASMNPARSLAPALVSGQLAHLWLYLVAPPLGALLAVVAFRAVRAAAPAGNAADTRLG